MLSTDLCESITSYATLYMCYVRTKKVIQRYPQDIHRFIHSFLAKKLIVKNYFYYFFDRHFLIYFWWITSRFSKIKGSSIGDEKKARCGPKKLQISGKRGGVRVSSNFLDHSLYHFHIVAGGSAGRKDAFGRASSYPFSCCQVISILPKRR